MIKISFTNEKIENEPGPNFYWRGEPSDFLQLVFDLHRLGQNDDVEIDISKFDYIQISGVHRVKAKSSLDGKVLCAIEDSTIIINCTNSIWRGVLAIFLSISFYPSHNFIEFDNEDLIEEANFIISSEG